MSSTGGISLKHKIENTGKKLFSLKFEMKLLKASAMVTWKLYRFFLLFGLSFVILYPIIYSISLAFRPQEELFDPMVIWIPRHFTLQNITDAIKGMNYLNSLKNTLLLNMVSSLLNMATCAFAGYGFARFKFKERNFLFAMVLFTIIVPNQVTVIPMYAQYRYFDFFGLSHLTALFTGKAQTVNLLDSNLTFYLPSIFGVGLRSGLFIYIFRQFFRGLPKELEDAAYIDGCGPIATFIRVMVPSAKQAFLSVLILSIVWHWNEYYLTSMFFVNNKTISTALANLSTSIGVAGVNNLNPYEVVTRMQAGSLLAIGPLLIMYLFLQKYFTESIERTGIVG